MAHTEHTPGKAVKYEKFLVKVFSGNGNMTLIADTCISSTIPQDEAEANADRIVTCWNEYDEIKAELEVCKEREAKLRAALESIRDQPRVNNNYAAVS